jgi:hypothetical protein
MDDLSNLSNPPSREQTQEALVVLTQGLYYQIHGTHIWEREARALIAQSFTDAAMLKRLEMLSSKSVQRYVEANEEDWCVSTHNYSTFQSSSKSHRWKKYACFVLEYKNPPAQRMWKAVHEIAKREDKTPDEVITAIQNHASAVERLGEIAHEEA